MFRRCFDSLVAQRFSSADIDLHLVVVDNSPDCNKRAMLDQYQHLGLPLYFIHEPVEGIPNARNAALNALGQMSPDWIAFIDDDEIAPSEWIGRLHAAALHCDADVASGKVSQFNSASETQAAAEAWRPQTSFGKARRLPVCPTSNVLFRGTIISGASGLRFDEKMRYGGSDTEFFMRAHLRGARIFGFDDATVFEEYPADRSTFSYECMRAVRVGANMNYRYMKNFGGARGAYFVAQRIGYHLKRAFVCTLVGLLSYPFTRIKGSKKLRQGARNAATAFGSAGPIFGIRPNRYW